MTIFAPEIPAVRRLILRLLAENGGSFEGTEALCQVVPAARGCFYRNLHMAHKYHMVRRSKSRSGGRGHKSVWILTRKGLRYVES